MNTLPAIKSVLLHTSEEGCDTDWVAVCAPV